MTQFCVYAHLRPDLRPFYVGKGTIKRAYEFKPSARNRWHNRIVAKEGRANIIVEVMPCRSEAEAFLREQLAIKALRLTGAQLTNMTDGGEGPAGAIRSQETRAKIAAASSGNKNCLGRRASAETLRKMAAITKARWANPSYRELVTALHRGKKASPETRAKMSAAAKGRPFSDEHRRNLSRALTGTHPSAETLAKLSASHKGQYFSPELRQRLSLIRRGKKLSAETRARMSKPKSLATRTKMSIAFNGRTISAATRAKISATLKARNAKL